jgi:hypothetical protein
MDGDLIVSINTNILATRLFIDNLDINNGKILDLQFSNLSMDQARFSQIKAYLCNSSLLAFTYN